MDIDIVEVGTQPRHEPQSIRQHPGALRVDGFGILANGVAADILDKNAGVGVIDTNVADIIVLKLRAGMQIQLVVSDDCALVPASPGPAAVELMNLKIVRRIREHVPVVILAISSSVPF